MAKMVWMGTWDPRKDREVDSKDEQRMKDFLRDKYERKKWYRDPGDIKKDSSSKSPETVSTSPLPLPPSKVCMYVINMYVCTCVYVICL